MRSNEMAFRGMLRSSLHVCALLFLLCGGAGAAIPGMFVVQESRIEDPVTASAGVGKRFGVSGFDWAGDVDGDGIADLVVGAGRSHGDSGSIQFVLLDGAGRMKGAPIAISARDPQIAPLLSKSGAYDNFGGGVGVVRQFSAAENCGVIAAASTNKAKLWALKVCRDGKGLVVDAVSAIDSTTSPILQGFGSVRIGEQLRNIDTLSSGVVVLAATIPAALIPGTSTSLGAVLLVGLDPATLAWRKIGQIPESYEPTDPVMAQLSGSAAGFGRAVVRLTSSSGLRLGIVSWGDKPQARVHVLDLDARYKVDADRPILPAVGAETATGVYSAGSADFDHDGILDLVVGLPQHEGRNAVANVGGFSVVLLAPDGTPKDVRFFGPFEDGGGFVDTGSTLGGKSYLGWDVMAGDINGDMQPDVVLGAYGTASSAASLWCVRMKSRPWIIKAADTIRLDVDPKMVDLGRYFGGHGLKWRVVETSRSTVDPAVRCSEASGRLRCVPLGSNGNSTWKVVATDSGNMPESDHFSDSLVFPVVVSGVNAPPERSAKPLAERVILMEDQKDTVVAIFSRHFADPEGGDLTFVLTPLGGSTKGLVNYYQSTNSDTLHVNPIPLTHGLCSLQVSARDEYGAAALDTLVIELAHVNHPPVASDDSYKILESSPTAWSVADNDKDPDEGDVLGVAIVEQPRHGKVKVSSGKVLFSPDSFFVGKDSLRYALSDGHAMDSAWVRFEVLANSDGMRVYKALRDTTVQEDADTIVIHTDSLFFSGAGRFHGGSEVTLDNCKDLAGVFRDWGASLVKLYPKRHQWGRCEIVVRGFELVSSDGGATHSVVIHDDTLLLTVNAVLTPYTLPEDTIWLDMVNGQPQTVKFDTIDLDRDTLEYVPLGTLPNWMSLGAFALTVTPGTDGAKVAIAVRKKAVQGVTYLENTDTLVVNARFSSVSVQGRSLGTTGLRLSRGKDAMILNGGDAPARVELIDFDGRILQSVSVPARGRATIPLAGLRRVVVLRLSEAGHVSHMPLLVHP